MRLALMSLLLLVGAPALAAAEDPGMPGPVDRVARALGIPAGDFSLWVQEIGTAQPLVAHLPDVQRNPASTLKLVTSFAALQGLNPAYTWKTELHALGPIENGVLHGDLLIRGGGDPYLVAEEFWKLVSGLRDSGLRRIEGELVFDVSYFDLPPEDPGRFDNQPDRIYNIVPHPLLVNFNAMRFDFQPGGDGRSVRVHTAPELPKLQVNNRLRLRDGSCGGYQRGVALSVQEATRHHVLLEGQFPTGCQRFQMTRRVLEPESYAWSLFDVYWRQLGGELQGGWRLGTLPVNGNGRTSRPTHVHHSRSLGEVIRLVNKYSNNVMTRHLELTLGAERFGAPATPAKGEQAIREVLEFHGIDTRGIVLDNSAGLSRDVRISARQLGTLLSIAWQAPYMPEFASSLSLSGLDGTLRRRFQDQPMQGRMHLKTGTLDHVSAIAGYVQSADNRRYAVVLMINTLNAHRGLGEELQDALLNWTYRQ